MLYTIKRDLKLEFGYPVVNPFCRVIEMDSCDWLTNVDPTGYTNNRSSLLLLYKILNVIFSK